MTVQDGFENTIREDELYTQGMSALQAGKWQDAIRAFQALVAKYPDDPTALAALEQAEFRARIDSSARVRAKRWDFHPGPALFRLALIFVIAAMSYLAWRIISERIQPMQALAQEQRIRLQNLSAGLALLDGDRLDEAEAKFTILLAEDPTDQDALGGMARIVTRRQLHAICDKADALFAGEELVAAREQYVRATLLASDRKEILPCEATSRTAEINTRLTRDDLFVEAEARYNAGDYVAAIDKYRLVQKLTGGFERELIINRLYNAYMVLGTDIVNQKPAAPELIPVAVDYFTQALSVKPRNVEAQAEQRLGRLFVAGRRSYQAGEWQDAVSQLGAAHDVRPNYMGETLVEPLYDALIRYGDQVRDAGDYFLAWEQYRRASILPVSDTTLALGRIDSVLQFLTPTPTPTNTPTATPPPTWAPYVPPTPIPSATPAAPLGTYRNQIVFLSDKAQEEGYWVMNPDGSNRRYLGQTEQMNQEYRQLREKESYSPDSRFRVYNTVDDQSGNEEAQIFYQGRGDGNTVTTKRLTNFAKVSYDPVWSPDGSRIAFVSQNHTSDDIWTLSLDDLKPWNRTPNRWEWDKHPSWSPDSNRIVFWTNREGTKQIYVMDADGRTQLNISKVDWDEYDPIWVK